MALHNRRVDPRAPDTVEWGEQIIEGKTVVEFAELPARYGIRASQIFNPDDIICEIADDEYSPFTELTRIFSGNPTAFEFYADGGSAYVILHADNAGKFARITIYPGGSVLTNEVLNSDEFKGPQGDQGDPGPTGPAGGVDSVFARTGAVVAQTGDYTQDQVTDGSTYKQYSQTEKTKLAGIETGATKTPAGTVIQFAGAAAPTGYVACDGASLLRAGTYADLFAAIGTTYGSVDGTHFNVPDMRGLFVRGAGAHGTLTKAAGGAFDGGSIGATDNDKFQGHKVLLAASATVDTSTLTNAQQIANNNARGDSSAMILGGTSTAATIGLSSVPTTDGTNGTPRTGNETKPASIALLYCIKT